MSRHTALDHAEEILGYTFANRELLTAALTHPSALEGTGSKRSYERLEFLGDSILGAIVAREAFARFPELDEGGLTRIKVSLVSGASLSRVAYELGLGEVIIFGLSETGTGKRGMHSALENVYEAIVAAISLDGGYQAAHDFVERTLLTSMDESMALEPENPKSTLQELLQVHHVTPTYEIVETAGPPHDRQFVAQVLASGFALAKGEGKSKKEAEVAAAREALLHYEECEALVFGHVKADEREDARENSHEATHEATHEADSFAGSDDAERGCAADRTEEVAPCI